MRRELRRVGLADDLIFVAVRKDAPAKVARLHRAMLACLAGTLLLWVVLFAACS
jgi:hypothetical protein